MADRELVELTAAVKMSVADANTKVDALANHFRKLGLESKDAERAARGVAKGINRVGRDAQTGKRGLDAFTQAAVNARKPWRRFLERLRQFLVLVGTFVVLRRWVRVLTEFQTAIAEVGTIAGETEGRVQLLRQGVLELTRVLPKKAADVAAGAYQVLSAGITDASDALKVLRASTIAATAGLADTRSAVDAITTVLNAYQMSADEAARVGDVLFKTVELGKVTFPELAQNIGNVATSAALAGVSLEETAAGIATLTKFGINAAEATTSLNRLFLTLTSQSKSQAEAFKKLGVEFSVAAVQEKGFAAVLGELNKLTDAQIEKLAELFPNIRAARSAFVLAGKGYQEYLNVLSKTSQATGAAQRAMEKMNDTLSAQGRILLNQVVYFFQRELGPAVRWTTNLMKRWNRSINDDIDAQISVWRTLGETVTGINLEYLRDVRAMQTATEDMQKEFANLDDDILNFDKAIKGVRNVLRDWETDMQRAFEAKRGDNQFVGMARDAQVELTKMQEVWQEQAESATKLIRGAMGGIAHAALQSQDAVQRSFDVQQWFLVELKNIREVLRDNDELYNKAEIILLDQVTTLQKHAALQLAIAENNRMIAYRMDPITMSRNLEIRQLTSALALLRDVGTAEDRQLVQEQLINAQWRERLEMQKVFVDNAREYLAPQFKGGPQRLPTAQEILNDPSLMNSVTAAVEEQQEQVRKLALASQFAGDTQALVRSEVVQTYGALRNYQSQLMALLGIMDETNKRMLAQAGIIEDLTLGWDDLSDSQLGAIRSLIRNVAELEGKLSTVALMDYTDWVLKLAKAFEIELPGAVEAGVMHIGEYDAQLQTLMAGINTAMVGMGKISLPFQPFGDEGIFDINKWLIEGLKQKNIDPAIVARIARDLKVKWEEEIEKFDPAKKLKESIQDGMKALAQTPLQEVTDAADKLAETFTEKWFLRWEKEQPEAAAAVRRMLEEYKQALITTDLDEKWDAIWTKMATDTENAADSALRTFKHEVDEMVRIAEEAGREISPALAESIEQFERRLRERSVATGIRERIAGLESQLEFEVNKLIASGASQEEIEERKLELYQFQIEALQTIADVVARTAALGGEQGTLYREIVALIARYVSLINGAEQSETRMSTILRKRLRDMQAMVGLVNQISEGFLSILGAVSDMSQEMKDVLNGLRQMITGAMTFNTALNVWQEARANLQGMSDDAKKLSEGLEMSRISTEALTAVFSGGFGLIGGAVQLASGLFGGGPSPEELERQRIMKQNTESLNKLRRNIDELAGTFDVTGRRFAAASMALGQLEFGGSYGGAGGYQSWWRNTMDTLRRFGLTLQDLDAIAEEFGITIKNSEGVYLRPGLEKLNEALKEAASGMIGFPQTLEGALQQAQFTADIFDLEDPQLQLAATLANLAGVGSEFTKWLEEMAAQGRDATEALGEWQDRLGDLDELVSRFGGADISQVPGLERLMELDLTSAEGRAEAEQLIRDLFRQFQQGMIDIAALGFATPQEFLDLLGNIEGLLDQIGEAADEGVTQDVRRGVGITEMQANQLLAYQSTIATRAKETVEWLKQINQTLTVQPVDTIVNAATQPNIQVGALATAASDAVNLLQRIHDILANTVSLIVPPNIPSVNPLGGGPTTWAIDVDVNIDNMNVGTGSVDEANAFAEDVSVAIRRQLGRDLRDKERFLGIKPEKPEWN